MASINNPQALRYLISSYLSSSVWAIWTVLNVRSLVLAIAQTNNQITRKDSPLQKAWTVTRSLYKGLLRVTEDRTWPMLLLTAVSAAPVFKHPLHTNRRSTERNACYTHPHNNNNNRLTALCPGLPGWASTQNVKPICGKRWVAEASAGPSANLHLAPDR